MKDNKNHIKLFILIYLLITFFVCLISFIYINAFVGALVTGLLILANILIYYYKKSIIKKEILSSSKKEEILFDEEFVENLPFPIVVTDSDNTIVEYNKEFNRIFFNDGDNKKESITFLFKSKDELNLEKLVYDNTHYEVIKNEFYIKEQRFISYIFQDATINRKLLSDFEHKKCVVSLIYIDNYEELTQSSDETALPLLTAMIDRKLNNLTKNVNGIIKKFEKDRYIFIFTNEYLSKIQESKFEILNEIREISVGNQIPVTLSIGVGKGKETLSEAFTNAKAAIDLALGRGGDQAIIKDGEKYFMFGGKSGEVSHNARIRARVKADALSELISESDNVFVMGHVHADLDCFGSAIGISKMSIELGKGCNIILDEISSGIKSLYEIIKENDKEIFSRIIRSEDAKNLFGEKSLLIIVDTHRSSRVESPSILKIANQIVIIDHHRKNTDYIDTAVLSYHEPYASSTCELVTEVLQYTGKRVKLKQIEADALLAGITVDTKNFSIKTGTITFEAAAYLRRNGADGMRVKKLFQNDMYMLKVKAKSISDSEIIFEEMAVTVCPECGDSSFVVAAQTADELLNISGIKASFVLCDYEGEINISARSFGDVNVQLILEKLGGGGHQTVSGAQIPKVTVEEAKEILLKAIREYLEEVK